MLSNRCSTKRQARWRRLPGCGWRIPGGGGRERALNAEDVQEIVQDTYVRLLKKDCHALTTYNPHKSSLSTWLYCLTKNVAINCLKRSRLQTIPISDAPDMGGAASAQTSGETGIDIITAAGGHLSRAERMVLHLLFDKDLRPQEVAKRLGIAVSTVYVLKSRGIKKLRHSVTP